MKHLNNSTEQFYIGTGSKMFAMELNHVLQYLSLRQLHIGRVTIAQSASNSTSSKEPNVQNIKASERLRRNRRMIPFNFLL